MKDFYKVKWDWKWEETGKENDITLFNSKKVFAGTHSRWMIHRSTGSYLYEPIPIPGCFDAFV